MRTNTGGNRGDVVRLAGARLVSVVEIRKGSRFDENLIKKATGGDEITAAAKYESEVTFRPQFALVFAANDAPIVRDDDQGMWSRMVRVPFGYSIPAGMRDPQLPQKLAEPEVQSAILAWAVRGCLDWQRDGLGTAAAIDRSTAEYRQEMDRAGGFFADCCKFSDDANCWISSKSLREAYESWCHENGVRKPLIARDLAERLRARGCTHRRTGRARIWQGVRLLDPDESPDGDVVTHGDGCFSKVPLYPPHERLSGGRCHTCHSCHDDDPCEDAERTAIQEHGGG